MDVLLTNTNNGNFLEKITIVNADIHARTYTHRQYIGISISTDLKY